MMIRGDGEFHGHERACRVVHFHGDVDSFGRGVLARRSVAVAEAFIFSIDISMSVDSTSV